MKSRQSVFSKYATRFNILFPPQSSKQLEQRMEQITNGSLLEQQILASKRDEKKEVSIQEESFSGIHEEENKPETQPNLWGGIALRNENSTEKIKGDSNPVLRKQPKRTSVVELIGSSKPVVQEKADGHRLTVFVNKKDNPHDGDSFGDTLFNAPISVPPKLSIGDFNEFTVQKRVRQSVFEREDKPKDTNKTVELNVNNNSVPAFSNTFADFKIPSQGDFNGVSSFGSGTKQNQSNPFASGTFSFGSLGLQAEPPKEEKIEKEVEEQPQQVTKEDTQSGPFENKYYTPQKREFVSFEAPTIPTEKEVPSLTAKLEDEKVVEEKKIEVTKDGFKFDFGTNETAKSENTSNGFSFGNIDFGKGFNFGTFSSVEKTSQKENEKKDNDKPTEQTNTASNPFTNFSFNGFNSTVDTKSNEKPKEENQTNNIFGGFSFNGFGTTDKKKDENTSTSIFGNFSFDGFGTTDKKVDESSKEEQSSNNLFAGLKGNENNEDKKVQENGFKHADFGNCFISTGFGNNEKPKEETQNTIGGSFNNGLSTNNAFSFGNNSNLGNPFNQSQNNNTTEKDDDKLEEEENKTEFKPVIKMEVQEQKVDENQEYVMQSVIKIARLYQEKNQEGKVISTEWRALGSEATLSVIKNKQNGKIQLNVINTATGSPFVLCYLQKGVVSIKKATSNRCVFKCFEKDNTTNKIVPKYYTLCFTSTEDNDKLIGIIEKL
ncbi:hypothetical protein CL6EHI_085060 [Entamoeba histolytica]|uniref:Uncharacterized protein n=1 Tax=Entamoeba histolytica TaxID=5759 RepID=A0A175JNP0_ENTHI|nr:hypothetical protein CL6EHI_085060 [Entamoeba histolytica]